MKRWWAALVLVAALVASRGLLRGQALAGHDAAAFYANQGAFTESVRNGAWWPRWNGDGRYGYGEIRLQYRPPLPHFMAEPVALVTGRNILAANLAVALLVLATAGGTFVLCRKPLGGAVATVAATAAVCATPYLANLYLRGAWYETAAVAAMPWILWANGRLARGKGYYGAPFVVGALAWAALVCGHPQVGLLFGPVAAAQVLCHAVRQRSWRILAAPATALACGLLLAAPYWLVAWLELPLVRMQLYDLGMESHVRHFLDLKELWPAPWPDTFATYSGAFDYLGRPLHLQRHCFDPWTMAALALAPLFWFGRGRRCRWHCLTSMALWGIVLTCVALALPLSWGVWELVPPLRSYNFPWRTLTVANLCGALLLGVVLSHAFRAWRVLRQLRPAVAAVMLTLILTVSWSRAGGWAAGGGPTEADLRPEALRCAAGVPQQFHTPRWVTDYPTRPARADVEVIRGNGRVTGLARSSALWTFTLDAATPVEIRVNHHYYPGWRLESPSFPAVEAVPSETGLMRFGIPAGRHGLTLRFGTTPARTWAGVASALGAAAIVLVPVLGWRRSGLPRKGRP